MGRRVGNGGEKHPNRRNDRKESLSCVLIPKQRRQLCKEGGTAQPQHHSAAGSPSLLFPEETLLCVNTQKGQFSAHFVPSKSEGLPSLCWLTAAALPCRPRFRSSISGRGLGFQFAVHIFIFFLQMKRAVCTKSILAPTPASWSWPRLHGLLLPVPSSSQASPSQINRSQVCSREGRQTQTRTPSKQPLCPSVAPARAQEGRSCSCHAPRTAFWELIPEQTTPEEWQASTCSQMGQLWGCFHAKQ